MTTCGACCRPAGGSGSRTDWANFAARDDQKAPDGDWLTWLVLGGRGAGKTRTGAEWVRDIALDSETPLAGPIALVGETLADVREVMIEGVSGRPRRARLLRAAVVAAFAAAAGVEDGRHRPGLFVGRPRGAARAAVRRGLGRRGGQMAERRGDVGHAPVRPAPRRAAAPGGDHDAAADPAHPPADRRGRYRSSRGRRPATTSGTCRRHS